MLHPGMTAVFAVLALAFALFVYGRWRYDLVAVMALSALIVLGLVPPGEAFAGFAHPAVVTVAAVLIVGRGLRNSGLVDVIARWMDRVGGSVTLQLAALTLVCAVCSGFMNNVGALALFMPVALGLARRSGRPPSIYLMPLAFGSLLGGMTTLIGTPPNIIVAAYRGRVADAPFGFFDFTAVGAAIALASIAFIALAGWRLIPQRKGQASREELFRIQEYLTEVTLPEASPFAGRTLRDIEAGAEADAVVVGMVRGGRRAYVPSPWETLRAGDVLIVEADHENIEKFVQEGKLALAGKGEEDAAETKAETDGGEDKPAPGSEEAELVLVEAVVMANPMLAGRTAKEMELRQRYGVNLLAVARQGARMNKRLRDIRLAQGDVILLHGPNARIAETVAALGLLPLAPRGLRIGAPRRMALALAIFAAAVAAAVAGWLPTAVTFTMAALVMTLVGLVSLRELYESVEWPVIVLLGAMMPLGDALEETGGAAFLAERIALLQDVAPPWAMVAVVMIGVMCLSDIVNNAAAALLSAPIAVQIAENMNVSADPFLMAVAVGASCAFLTPIGHQANTLVMGPAGYRFGDYWRLGLPVELLIVALGVPMILWVWPL